MRGLVLGKKLDLEKEIKQPAKPGTIPVRIDRKTVIFARDADHAERIKRKYNLIMDDVTA